MDVMRRKRFGCSDIYSKDLLMQDENGGFWTKNGQNLDESSGFGAKMDKIWIFLPS